MPLYKIAGLTVMMNPVYDKLRRNSEKYRISGEHEPDIIIEYNPSRYAERSQKYLMLSEEEYEYSWCGSVFYYKLGLFDGMMLHASAVIADGKCYFFSAPSGTGKSTHTALWQRMLGEDNAVILNDDKPALRLIDGRPMSFGTPFSGKTDLNLNLTAPIGAICFLEQAGANSIEQIYPRESLPLIMEQTLRWSRTEPTEKMMSFLDIILKTVPVYRLKCTPTIEAAELSYGVMSGMAPLKK
jgi:hypothetical protein